MNPETEVAGIHQGALKLEWSGGEISIPLTMTVEVMNEPVDPGNTAEVTPVRPVESQPDPEKDPDTEVANVPEKPSISAESPRGVLSGNFSGETKAEAIKNSYARYYGISLTDEPMHPDVPSATNLKLVEGDHQSVKISFTPAKGDIKGYDIEMAQMFIDTRPGSSGKIEKRWIIWPGESENIGQTESGDTVVKLEPMMPATEYEFRIVARDQSNRRALPSDIYVITTGMYVPLWKRILSSAWLKWLIVGAAILFVWKLLSSRRDESAQKGKVNAGGESGGIRGMLEGVRGAIFR